MAPSKQLFLRTPPHCCVTSSNFVTRTVSCHLAARFDHRHLTRYMDNEKSKPAMDAKQEMSLALPERLQVGCGVWLGSGSPLPSILALRNPRALAPSNACTYARTAQPGSK
jgi:hypothetical protein